MDFFKKIELHLVIIKELMSFFWHQKLWWLIPFVAVLILLSLLLLFAQASPIAPFIYPIL